MAESIFRVIVTGEPSRPDDSEVPGAYQIGVDSSVPEEAVATVALDCFHENIGIEFLEDFDIQVLAADGREIAEVEAYAEREIEVEGGATFYGKIDDHELNDEVSSPSL